MEFPPLHSWQMDSRQAVALQKSLAAKVRLVKDLPDKMKLVAGVDVSYEKHGDLFYGGVVVLSFPEMETVEEVGAVDRVHFPYVPGLLSFRELPVLLEAFRSLQSAPDAVLVDGQGIAHPRRFGLASHLGLWLDLPAIGCAKTRLCGEYEEPGPSRGEAADLCDGGELIGQVVRTRDRVRPLFVSPGHLVEVRAATALVLACGGGYRLPEPTRRAHLFTNRLRLAAREQD